MAYVPLGSGTPSGSNWDLVGLNFPTGQNFYIRARGYYRGGFCNGSESIAESVRNAFIPEPMSAPTPTPTPEPTPFSTPPPTATPTPSSTPEPTTSPFLVEEVTLPTADERPIDSSHFRDVKTSDINPNDNLIGFQGSFTFDETVFTFQDPPVSFERAGNWSITGNVLPGPGPIRTLQVTAFSEDSTPLEGAGPLFRLRMIPNLSSREQAPWSGNQPQITLSSSMPTSIRMRPGARHQV